MNLESFIQNNRLEFDTDDLPIGHEQRFKDRFKPKAKRHHLSPYWISSIAACLMIVFGAEYLFRLSANEVDSPLIQQFDEIKLYYTMKIENEIDQLKSANPSAYGYDILVRESDLILEEKTSFEQAIAQLPKNERMIEVVTSYYSHVLDSIENMQQQLNEERITIE